jgi:hypothetical protein
MIGMRLPGGYVLGEQTATGGMGGVHRATDARGRPVAAKRLLPGGEVTRFEIEARMLRRLSHPRVVEVLDTVVHGPEHYLIMEWVDGEDLAALLRRAGAPGLPVADVTEWTLQAAEALRYVHAQQLVHRDVKPQNLMLARDRGVVLIDFGIARELAPDGGTRDIGTPGYMAPEAFTGGPFTPRTDVYGLAATAWALLTGRPPQLGALGPPPEVPPPIAATLVAALSVDPERRLESVDALAAGLGGDLPATTGRGLGVSADPRHGELLEAVTRTAAAVFDAAATSLALALPDGALSYRAAWGAGADLVVGMTVPRGRGIGGRVLATGVGEVVPDCRSDPDFASAVAARTGYVPHTLISVPLIDGAAPIGVLTILDRRDGSPYDVADLRRAAVFADLACAALRAGPGAPDAPTAAA